MKERLIQLLTAAVLSVGGIVLLYLGAYFAPQGQIHESILVAFGEIATFCGAVFGIDYTYRWRNKYDNHPNKNRDTKT